MPHKKILKLVCVVVAAAGVTVFLTGLVETGKAQTNVKPNTPMQAGLPAGPAGRYQIVINPNVRADTILLDTQTGQTWTQTQITDVAGAPTVWMYRDRLDNDLAFVNWTVRHVANDQKQK
jgi:hypothetical protein